MMSTSRESNISVDKAFSNTAINYRPAASYWTVGTADPRRRFPGHAFRTATAPGRGKRCRFGASTSEPSAWTIACAWSS